MEFQQTLKTQIQMDEEAHLHLDKLLSLGDIGKSRDFERHLTQPVSKIDKKLIVGPDNISQIYKVIQDINERPNSLISETN